MKLVNKRDLAELLGVTERTLTTWQRQGLPIHATGARGQGSAYDVPQVIRWLIARRVQEAKLIGPRDRLANLQAERIAIDIAEKRGELAPSAQFRDAWRTLVVEARQALLALPEALIPKLRFARDPDAMHEILTAALTKVLHELAGEQRESEAKPRGPRAHSRGARAVGAAAGDPALGVGRGKHPAAGGLADAGEVPV